MNFKKSLLIMAALASASAMAQTQRDTAQPTAGDQWIPLMAKTENGITYMCGGVGENEAAAMKQAATKADFDMMVTFAASNGAYVADVNVEISDAKGNSVLNTTCDGPIMLVDFEKGGKYRIKADLDGHAITRTAQVSNGGKPKNLNMLWPTKVVDMGLTPNLRQGVTSGGSAGHRMSGSSGDSGIRETVTPITGESSSSGSSSIGSSSGTSGSGSTGSGSDTRGTGSGMTNR